MSGAPESRLRLASYNVCNLYEDGADAKSRRALASLGHVLDALDADLIGLQEIASAALFGALNGSLARPYPVCRQVVGNCPRGLHLGVLSRRRCRVANAADVTLSGADGEPLYERPGPGGPPEPLRLQRSLARVDVYGAAGDTAAGAALAVFVLHLKSSVRLAWRLLDADVVRRAEARAVVARVDAWRRANPGVPFALVGDLNEPADGPAVGLLRDALGLRDVLDEDWLRVGRAPAYTWRRRRARARLDYLLLDPLAARCRAAGSARVHVSAGAVKASDHFPLCVDLML